MTNANNCESRIWEVRGELKGRLVVLDILADQTEAIMLAVAAGMEGYSQLEVVETKSGGEA